MAALVMLLCLVRPACAEQILAVHVSRHGSHFVIALRIALAVPPAAAFAALQDYTAMPRFNPDLRRVRVKPTARPDRVRLFVTVHACVLIFCKTLHQEQIVTATPEPQGGRMSARLVPQGGDFRSGQASWWVHPCATVNAPSCLQIRIALQPAFWVPPLIGPWILQRKLYREARRSSRGIEQIAAMLAARAAASPALSPQPVRHP
jgi:hypothetical protein